MPVPPFTAGGHVVAAYLPASIAPMPTGDEVAATLRRGARAGAWSVLAVAIAVQTLACVVIVSASIAPLGAFIEQFGARTVIAGASTAPIVLSSRALARAA
jgi:hypothetical protein